MLLLVVKVDNGTYIRKRW